MKTSSRQIQQQRIAEASLEQKTQLYWQIGIARRGKGPLQGTSMEKAIGLLSDLEMATSWDKPLGVQITDMLDSVIGRPSKRKFAKALDKPKSKGKYVPTHYDDWDGPSAA